MLVAVRRPMISLRMEVGIRMMLVVVAGLGIGGMGGRAE